MKWWLSVLLAAWGCSEAPGNPRTITSEPEFLAATESAVARWNAAAGLGLEVVSSGGEVKVRRAECRTEGAWGCGGHRVAKIDSPPEGYLDLAVAHELAHALGAKHTERGVMDDEGFTSVGCITEEDIVSICSGYTDCTAFNPEC